MACNAHNTHSTPFATRTTHSTPKLGATSSSMSSIYRSSPAKRSKPGGGAPSSKSVGEGELDAAARSDARWRVEGGSRRRGWPAPAPGSSLVME
eukprot:TRINITY_DN409_c0_g1_i2.p1 TRINITY_DN409_c0_g1~~TRINITY_DN409_c0_g1_i2.p1  ORF type:complete len:94 (+),score=12.21 TRINITY_DN409_c0_g1_i2:45-326(+)